MIFDYMTLQIIWWVMIGVVLILYATTAGFDFGITLMLPFLRRKARFVENDEERRLLINTIAPTWDGNQTWLVFAGGALFVIWPQVYASTFSGMYALMLFILWSFFLRPPGFDYRSKLPSETWRKAWDWALFISAFFPVLAFGLAVGNLFVGLPIHFDPFTLRSFYSGNFFDLFNSMGVICALASLFMLLMHGAAHANRRTTGDLRAYFQRLYVTFGLSFLLLMTIGGLLLMYRVPGYILVHSPVDAQNHPLSNVVQLSVGAWYQSFNLHPWKWIGPIVTYVAVILALLTRRKSQGGLSFWLSALAVSGAVATFGAALFPFVIPSSIDPAQSLTVWNATSTHFTLMGMFYISAVVLLLIFAYKFWGFAAVWQKKKFLTVHDVKQNSHSFY